ncbi:Tar ligand binding domain-containing protein [Paraburkholderia fungorum]|uniref:Chemotaxis protein CheA n=1 Tax=Paraburkholderia fungorum TaxID=134537 RepID=A0A3R7F6A7_9BURK|nr:Tar ligand binding domain-containing protein [Paraburkholderia fungorum]RKF40859.1 chemotaxis protein CheA [Paraburkholderia fungorum]
MFKRLTIQNGLTLTIAGYTLALIATMLVAVLGLKQSNDALKQTYATDTVAITHLKTSSELLLQVQLALGNYETLFSMGRASDDLLPKARAVLKASDDNWSAYLAKPRNAEESRAADAVQAARAALIKQALEPEFQQLEQNDYYKFHTTRGEADSLNARYAQAMNALEALQVDHQQARFDEAQAQFRRLMVAAAMIALAALGIGFFARAALAAVIGRPLARMQSMMSEIASSQDFTRRVPVGRLDEIGRSIVTFNEMIEKIQQSSALLKQKTADIQAMLQNIQQGMLTVVDGGLVHAEYSAYLEAIFETKDIAGRPVMELVFEHTGLNSDVRSQVDTAIYACIGEDAINFTFNQHLLVNEVAKTMTDGRVKTLDLSWSAITDENDIVMRLMLCVRDVTELRHLAAEASEQKRRLEMIGEILAVNEEKFHHFVDSATGFVNENERIIRQHTQADSEALAELFRNVHTIKGNARTYSLQHLTSIVHETERRYDALRRNDVSEEWNQEVLIADLERVKQAIERYRTINDVSLGRKDPGRRGNAEQHLMVDREHIQESLRLLEAVDPVDVDSLLTMRDSVRRTLRILGTETIREVLSGVLESLPSLARELGKEPPIVRIDDGGYRVDRQVSSTLKNVFMHLMRNSVDHGIETAAARIAQGKAAAGTIVIEAGVDRGALQITLSDDGLGLALGRIRSIGRARGWLDAGAQLSDELVADFIFHPGFSTAEKVTEVSGRGVGMDAVRDFLKRENGSIALRFTDDRCGADYRLFQIVVCLPERCAVQSTGALDEKEEKPLQVDSLSA